MDQIKWAFEQMKGRRLSFFLGVLLSLVATGLLFWSNSVIAMIIDQVFGKGNKELLLPFVLTIMALVILRALCTYFGTILTESSSQRTIKLVRTYLYDKLQSMQPSYYMNNRTGDIMTRLTGDLDWLRHFIAGIIPSTITSTLMLVGSLALFFSMHAVLTLSVLILTPATVLLTIMVRKLMRNAHQEVREQVSLLNTVVQENISGNRVVKAFVREDFETNRFGERNTAFRNASVNVTKTWMKFSPILDLIANTYGIVILALGGIFVIQESLTIGQFSLFMSLSWMINEPMRSFGNIINESQRFIASAEKIMVLYYSRPDIYSPENAYVPENPKGEFEIDNVTFMYGKQTILSQISIKANAGETIGIMGSTGSGKTTVTSLISRFLDPTTGRVTIDGVDVRRYDLHALRRLVSISMQDVFLFSDTVDANIAYGDPESPEDFVVQCAVDADADEFIRRMSDKYQTIIGERGVGLSGGQRQRIALARALDFDAPILILDDTTSAVDLETEQYIYDRLKMRARKSTTVIVAQRISSVKHADCIYIFDKGRIIESGSHEELLAKKGYYYSIYCMQQGMKENGGDN